MTDQPHRYFYGRLNIAGNFTDKREYILRGLRSGTTIESHGHIWQFVEVTELPDQEGLFVHGYLVKYKRETAEEVVVPEAGTLGGLSIPNVVVAKARFFLHVTSGIIAYHPIPGQIEPSQFRTQFSDLFVKNHESLMVSAFIESVDEEYRFRNEVARMTVVTRIHFTLHPSNPNSRDAWRKIDERLQKLGVETYQEDYKTKGLRLDGQTVVSDEELLSKMLMTEDGYGDARVTGRIDGKVKTIKTHDNPITSNAPDDDTPAHNVLESLMLTIRGIFRRYRQ